MKPVVWTERVLGQLEAIRDHIAQVSPVYADHMVARIFARRDQIGRFPESGRIVPEADNPAIREVLEWPYRVIYRVRSDCVEVIAVVHGRRGDIGGAARG